MPSDPVRTYPSELPALALRETVVFPLTLQPLAITRPTSIESVNRALASDRLLFLTLQTTETDEPQPDHLKKIGTIAAIRQMAKVPAGGVHVIVEGLTRARADLVTRSGLALRATVQPLPEQAERTLEVDAYVRRLHELIDRALSVTSGLSQELRGLVAGIDDPLRLGYLLSSLLDMKADEKQQILEQDSLIAKLQAVASALNREIALLELKGKIESAAEQEMTDAQRQYFLRQQLKAIQDELGEGEKPEAQELRRRVAEAKLPEAVHTVAGREIDRLERMTPASPEYQMIRTYIDWILDVPWSVTTEDRLDPAAARRVLDEDHYDLDKVKERIVEYLAVQKLKSQQRPAALLEVLDPAQNHSFRDHYLEINVDLSRVLFIATSNQLGTIHPALVDRMEVISLAGYSEEEKLHIARRYLIPRQLDEHGLAPAQVTFEDDAIRRIVSEYTREAGVRNLERQIGAVARKIAARVAAASAAEGPAEAEGPATTEGPAKAGHYAYHAYDSTVVRAEELPDYLGPPRFKHDVAFRVSRPGVATGVAWTETGGDVLFVEASLLPAGHHDLILTGQLGSVMQESARAAVSHIRAAAGTLGVSPEFLDKYDLHVHVPAGAIPKDGPSAGVTMATAIVSALRDQPVRQDVAMTGEITLSGLILPVGGIREKALAARRHGISTFILPKRNEADLAELPPEVKDGMRFVPVDTLEDALNIALPPPRPPETS